jgi:hypothetical protein
MLLAADRRLAECPMFSQLQFVRLRAAEQALRDGRVDDAYRLATAPDLKDHPRAVAVLAGLSEKFLARARDHFRADRHVEALRDLDKAVEGGEKRDEIAELRHYVTTVAAALHQDDATRQAQLDAARRRVERGSLAAGRGLLADVTADHPAAKQIRDDIDRRARDVADMLAQAQHVMDQSRFAEAANRLRRARSLDGQNPAVSRMESDLCTKVFAAVRAALREGRLARAGDELAALDDLGASVPEKGELVQMLGAARQAAAALHGHDFGEARRHAMMLARLLPEAGWMKESVEQLRQVEDLHTALLAGPLGESVRAPAAAGRVGPVSLDETIALPNRGAGEAVPQQLLLLVDGGGSFLVLRGDATSIGRAAAKAPANMPLISDMGEREAVINRVEDDYFLLAAKDVEVSGRSGRQHLLRDGDRVVLGRQGKFTFRVPSRRSATAVLDLSDTTKMPADVRRVVLMRHHATIGSGPGAHISCRHAGVPLVLFERDGSLWIRPRGDGAVHAEPRKLVLGESVEMAGVTMVMQPFKPTASRTA